MKTIAYDVVYFRLLTVTVLVGLVLAALSSSMPNNLSDVASATSPTSSAPIVSTSHSPLTSSPAS